MRNLIFAVAIVALGACTKEKAPVVADTTAYKLVKPPTTNSRYILISNVTSPYPGCTEVSPGRWSCPVQ